jgi:hypothetical protein
MQNYQKKLHVCALFDEFEKVWGPLEVATLFGQCVE